MKFVGIANNTTVSIDLIPGVYSIDPKSATGKTYLCETLKYLAVSGEPVIGYTYNDYILGIDADTFVGKRENLKIAMFDRYGMYPVYNDLIKELGKKAIVLVDHKEPVGLGGKIRFLKLENSKISVY